ncbi:MAG: class I SAM-dependent methyltransferase [Elainellaceae cyanobacterium]
MSQPLMRRLLICLLSATLLLASACSNGSLSVSSDPISSDPTSSDPISLDPIFLDPTSLYQEKAIHSFDGIGKFYMGREIAQVMGHRGAAWLERSSRVQEEQPDAVVASLDLQPTDVVADIGAGTGYFSFRIAPYVPEGEVLAVDIQPEMLEMIQFLKQENQVETIETVLGDEDNPHLAPETVDLALMVDAYHEFAYPYEMMVNLVQAIKPGGRIVLVEYRGENPLVPIKPLHKMTEHQVKQEMQAVGLVWQETKEFLPQQHVLVFQKAG